jgi:serine O-acetyltransferase
MPHLPARSVAEIASRHPPFVETVIEDARVALAYRAERRPFGDRREQVRQVIRLCLRSDAFLAQVCYRAKASMQAAGVPVLPRIAHRLAMALAQVCIGDPVIVGPGLYLPHGQVVFDGVVEIGRNATVRPWVTIGLKDGNFNGAHIDANVNIGTGAKIIGPVHIGEGAYIGANAVVVRDVPPHAVAAGVPARIMEARTPKDRKRDRTEG